MRDLIDFYMAALDAELTYAPRNEFGARMASYYCRLIMALEQAA